MLKNLFQFASVLDNYIIEIYVYLDIIKQKPQNEKTEELIANTKDLLRLYKICRRRIDLSHEQYGSEDNAPKEILSELNDMCLNFHNKYTDVITELKQNLV